MKLDCLKTHWMHCAVLFLVLGFFAQQPCLASIVTTWSTPPAVLSAAGSNATDIQVASSSDGTKATAVWKNYVANTYIVQTASATISAGVASWGAVQTLTTGSGGDAENARIALSSDGTKATAVWQRTNSNFVVVVQTASATISGAVASWGAVTNLSGSNGAAKPQVALSSDGTRASAVWSESNSQNYVIRTASTTISGTPASWGTVTVTDLSATGGNADFAQIALSSDGTKATVIWQRINGSNNKIIQTASTTFSGTPATWGTVTVTDLSATGYDAGDPQVALSSDGIKATAVWKRFNGSNTIIQAASTTISGGVAAWGAVTDLSATGQNASEPQVALSSDGTRATAVWTRRNGSNPNSDIIQTASTTISGTPATWGTVTVTDLSATGGNAREPQVGLSSDGTRAMAVWTRASSGIDIGQAAVATISGVPASWVTANVTDLPANGGTVWVPQVAFSSDGTQATAVWIQPDSNFDGIAQTSSALITYPPSPTGHLNDTGSTHCFNAARTALVPCDDANTGNASSQPGQDGRYGRDPAAANSGSGFSKPAGSGGTGGFAFTPLDASGNPIPLTGTPPAPSATPRCIKDNVTNLIWEVKTDDSGLQDKDWTYSWGPSNNNAGATCGGTLTGTCNSDNYITALNAANACPVSGAGGWRLPTRRELLSIVDQGRATGPVIDVAYFPNTAIPTQSDAASYWSSDVYMPGGQAKAWIVQFSNGLSLESWQVFNKYVRLVRNGP